MKNKNLKHLEITLWHQTLVFSLSCLKDTYNTQLIRTLLQVPLHTRYETRQ